MGLASLTIQEFLDRLGSSDPTPGGGALAALAGAMAAAMLSMVGNLTVGHLAFADLEPEVRRLLEEIAELRQLLLALADADAEAYAAVAQAYRLPRATEPERRARSEAIEANMRRATEVPVETAEAAYRLLTLAYRVAELGNPSVLSDASVAALLAMAAARAAAEQARYNLATLKDASFVAEMRGRIEHVLGDADVLADSVMSVVDSRIGKA